MQACFRESLTIVVPCFRSGAWTADLVNRIDHATRDLKGRRELILVDDASPDSVTWPALEEAAQDRGWVRAMRLQFNVGQFRATLAGMEHATGDWVATLDDDLQTPPEEIPKLLRAAAENPEMDVIIGAYARKRHSLLRNVGSRIVSSLYKRFYGKPEDFQTTSFRLIRRSVAQVLCSYDTRRPQLGALILQSTQPQHRMNVEVDHHDRVHGESGYTWGGLIELGLDNVFQASLAPLRVMTVAGFGVALGSFVLSLFYLGRWALGYIQEPGFATLVLLLTFIAGTMLLSIGIVGEYVQRVVAEVTGQPRHVIREERGNPATAAREQAPRERSRLLVLGASALQLPFVQRAVEMGLHVVTADNVPSNPAHEWSHEQWNVSTRDTAALVRAATDSPVHAVMTAASDVAVPGVAAVAQALGLRDATGLASRDWLDKERFRAFQARAGLRAPDGFVCASTEELDDKSMGQGRYVVKPVDRSGSRAVRVVDGGDSEGMARAVAEAIDVSFSGRARVERFVEGDEFGGDGVVLAGQLVHFFVTRKRLDGCGVRGHLLPSGLSPALEARIAGELQAHVQAADFECGVLNADVRLGPDGMPVVLEMSPRLGGNGIRDLVRESTGFDLAHFAIQAALGEAPESVRIDGVTTPAAAHTLGATHAGTVMRIPELGDIQRVLPDVISVEFDVAVGDTVRTFHDSRDQVGRALTRGGDSATLGAALDALFSEGVMP